VILSCGSREHNGRPTCCNPFHYTHFMESHYFVSLKKTEEGYSVWVPGLPGCWSQGANEDAALSNIRDAIGEYLSAAQELASEGEVREVALTL
jgi:predicted RNase H-like HicB family nuclease